MDTFVSVQFILTSYIKIMHICKSVLKYYNFIFYSIRPLTPSRTGGFCLYNHTIIHYMTMCRGRWKAFMSKSSGYLLSQIKVQVSRTVKKPLVYSFCIPILATKFIFALLSLLSFFVLFIFFVCFLNSWL